MANTDLSALQLESILPPSIQGDVNLDALAAALDTELHAQVTAVDTYLPINANLDNLPDRILDLLAWQFYMDFWDVGLTSTQKRALIRGAVAFHRIRGTKAAVLSVVNAVFPAGEAILEEWFEYGGSPYYFRVRTDGVVFTPTNTDYLIRLINMAKNTRSWMQLTATRSSTLPVGVGVATRRIVRITSTVS